ncbi:hypothetical protein BLNAU_2199 [Blattamonas nauphoetae]|uniref:Uncharacterized protein n=1 Tax=Blattamonas nauphoetae TaxID=2049346 RepID=A0ABQ9YGJ0_9EUKA|nr:hypothetical protein BLNAU_2199 [Blattamonas nauphoetae]
MIQARLESQSPAISAASSASLLVTGGEDMNLKPHRDSSPTKLTHSEQFPSFSDSLLSRFESIKDKTQRQAQHIIRSQRSARQSQLNQNQSNDDAIKKIKRDEPTSSDVTDSTESPKQEEKPAIPPDTAFRQLSAVLNSLYSQSQTLEGASVPLFDSSPPSSQRRSQRQKQNRKTQMNKPRLKDSSGKIVRPTPESSPKQPVSSSPSSVSHPSTPILPILNPQFKQAVQIEAIPISHPTSPSLPPTANVSPQRKPELPTTSTIDPPTISSNSTLSPAPIEVAIPINVVPTPPIPIPRTEFKMNRFQMAKTRIVQNSLSQQVPP